jgi:asparagine synthase (glutamine-hydrolysing)
MCGIAGFVGSGDRESAAAAVRDMLCALAHRGPDAEGIENFEGAVLGHRRLSIFDLSDAGRQPMMTPDRSVAVVFNGAIYNFHALRAELRSAGYHFVSQTDTEVLLHGYVEWGLDRLLSRLRGMFAFGLWDHSLRTLYLVRDRLGVKPLVYATRGGEIVFASTPRALRWSGLAGEIDPQAMAEYLEFGYVTDDRTIYRDVRKLPAAGILEWREGKLSSRQYWTPPEVDESRAPSFEEAVEETERLFLESVKLRLQADVPVGALLSGGVDSSLVCWAVARLGADITAFTVGAQGDPLDETRDARQTARLLGIRHEAIDLSPEETPDLGEMVSAYGEPFACASALGMLRVSRAVKRSATVLLTGDGGDDVFLGYPEHQHFWMAERLARKLPSSAGSLWRGVRGVLPPKGMLRRGIHFLDYATGGLGAVTRAHPGLNVYRQREMLGDRLVRARIPAREIPLNATSARRLLAEFLAYDRRNRFVGEYLTKVDGATMFHALEARSPFLDQEIWNFASSLPFGLRLRGGRLKAILRELASRHVSSHVAEGAKRGFAIPVSKWLVGRWRGEFEDMFQRSFLEREGWIRGAQVLKEFRKSVDLGSAPNSLWYLFVLENWLRRELQPLDRSNAPGRSSEMHPVSKP